MTDIMIPASRSDEELRGALLRAVGFDKLSEPQRELALAIAHRYELDPMLKHLVMIEGKPYITRDGLLHVAHRSNDFDGIEVTDPVLDAEPDPKGRRFWRVRCTVWRKSFKRPFVYPGRYPMTGRNDAYAEEMAIKVGEVMCLRRAFDVAAPTLEERWEESGDATDEPVQPTSLLDKIAQRAEAIAVAPDADGSSQSDEPAQPTVSVSPPVEAAPEPSYGRFVAPAEGFAMSVTPAELSAATTEPERSPLDVFSDWASAQDMTLVRATAKALFPDIKKFGDLTGQQLNAIVDEVERAQLAAATEEAGEAIAYADETLAGVEPDAVERSSGEGGERIVETDVSEKNAAPPPFMKPVLCDVASPLSSSTCTLDAGHKGAHRAGLRESWA